MATTSVVVTHPCPYCDRSFKSKIGLGVHKSSAHKDEHNGETGSLPKSKKVPWPDEEAARFAKAEAALSLQKVRYMNKELMQAFRYRTIDSIKGRRKQSDHKLLVQKFLKEMSSPRHTSEESSGTSSVAAEENISPDQQSDSSESATVPDERFRCLSPNLSSPSEASTIGIEEYLETNYTENFKNQSSNDRAVENSRMEWRTDGVNMVAEGQASPGSFNATLQREVLDFVVKLLQEHEDSNPHMVKLKSIVNCLEDHFDHSDVLSRLDQFISGLIPVVTNSARNSAAVSSRDNVGTSRRQQRAAEYKIVQRLYGKSRKAAAKYILNGAKREVEITKERFGDFNAFWQKTMAPDQAPTLKDGPFNFVQDPWYEVMAPIKESEVRVAYPDKGSAAGPDNLTVDLLRKIPLVILVCLYNIFVYLRDVPSCIKPGRTILIPKSESPSGPGEYRPITVASVLLRHYHKVLATRLTNVLTLNRRQRAFIHGDGCFENIMLYLSLIRDARSRFQPLNVAVIDIKKAFDSVLFSAVLEKLTDKGAPPSLIEYLHRLYKTSSTYLTVGPFRSEIRPTRGVRQGDPLSPVLFNVVIDSVLNSLPSYIGYKMPSVEGSPNNINVLAFADDLVLCATTPDGLQELLDIASEKLRELGLEINAAKCTSLSLAPHRKLKKNCIDTREQFKIGTDSIKAAGVESYIKYLGIRVNSRGKPSFSNELKSLCDALGRAPLKPQQRLFLLKNFALPRLTYSLCMGDYVKQHLKTLDRLTRSYIRKWLDLPRDLPLGAFHCSVKDGGLGVLPFEYLIPAIRLKRLTRLESHEDPVFRSLPSLPYFSKEKAKIMKDRERCQITDNPDGFQRYLKWSFNKTYDGAKLQEADLCPEAHRWISDGTKFVRGHDFIYMLKARYNALPVRSRCARGRNKDTRCRHGCPAVETLTHVSSLCPVSQPARLTRHNSVLKYLYRRLQRMGCEVEKERRYVTTDERGICTVVYPDLIVKKEGRIYILDVHICGDTKANLDKTAYYKTAKYANNKDLIKQIKGDGSCDPVVLGVTVSFRGIFAPASAALLKSMGLLGEDFKVMAVKALEGTIRVFRQFMKGFRAPNKGGKRGAKTITPGAVDNL